MLKSSVVLTGRLLIQKMNEKGEVIYKTEVPNIVVTAGKEFIASRLVSNDADVMNYMAIGDDPSSAVVTQTALQNELARNEVSGAIALNTTTTFTATFLAGTGTGDIKEAGIFNTGSSSVHVFDADAAVDNGSNIITIIDHGFVTGDKVTYTDGGGTAISGLIDGGTYYVINLTADTLQLATTAADADDGIEIDIEAAALSGANHKLTYGTMLCRTTFPVITKGPTEALSISWVVTVG